MSKRKMPCPLPLRPAGPGILRMGELVLLLTGCSKREGRLLHLAWGAGSAAGAGVTDVYSYTWLSIEIN